jgi:hypothetical protein
LQPSTKHMKSGLTQKYMEPSTKHIQLGLMQKHMCNHEQNICNQDLCKNIHATMNKTHAIRTMQKHTCNCQQKHMQSGLMQKHEYTRMRLWKTSCLLQTCSSENCQKKSTIPFKCLHQALEEDGFAQHSC